MSRILPLRPDFDQLKHQAKDLLKAHTHGDAAACAALRRLREWAPLSEGALLAKPLALHDAQYALALDYGFPSWSALKQHVERSAPNAKAARLRRTGAGAYIEEVPPLTWRDSACSFAGAFAAASSVTRRPVCYADIMGFTGLAFRVRWFRGQNPDKWCPSSPVGEFPDEVVALESATGWHFRTVDRMKEEAAPGMERFGDDIVRLLDAGVPAVGYPGDLNVGVLRGYDRDAEGLHLIWNAFMENDKRVLIEKTGPWLLFLHDSGGEADIPPAVMGALARAARLNRSDGLYRLGDYALATWIDDIARAEEWTAEQRASLFFVSGWCFNCLEDARRSAVAFLNKHAPLFEGEVQEAMRKAAALYAEEVATLGPVYGAGNAFLGPWSGKTIDDWTAEVRKREMSLLETVRSREAAAVAELERAVSGAALVMP